MPGLIDISPLVSERIGVWPGDMPYRRRVSLSIEDGANLALSSVRSTLHVGAHADAPGHTMKGGCGIHEMPLETYYGPCQILEVSLRPGARIRPADLRDPVAAPRVLFRTNSFPDPERFTSDFNSLSPQLVDFLHQAGVILVGVDTPSVDPFGDEVLEAHQALGRHGMANLEGLVLTEVTPGLYTLVALPLRLEGADASPVRAVLLSG
jgi:arylformamidase